MQIDCCLQGQGHRAHIVRIWLFLWYILDCYPSASRLNLMVQHRKLECLVKRGDYCVQSQGYGFRLYCMFVSPIFSFDVKLTPLCALFRATGWPWRWTCHTPSTPTWSGRVATTSSGSCQRLAATSTSLTPTGATTCRRRATRSVAKAKNRVQLGWETACMCNVETSWELIVPRAEWGGGGGASCFPQFAEGNKCQL